MREASTPEAKRRVGARASGGRTAMTLSGGACQHSSGGRAQQVSDVHSGAYKQEAAHMSSSPTIVCLPGQR